MEKTKAEKQYQDARKEADEIVAMLANRMSDDQAITVLASAIGKIIARKSLRTTERKGVWTNVIMIGNAEYESE